MDISKLYQIYGAKQGYYVDKLGQVFSANGLGEAYGRIRQMRPVTNSNGYQHVLIRMADSSRKTYLIHHIVLNTFVGPRSTGQETRHLDGDRTNNALSNLEWGTRLVNNRDKYGHGTMPVGERHHQAKLTEEDVRAIRRRLNAGETSVAIAADYGVAWPTIDAIYRGESWTHVPLEEPMVERKGGRRPGLSDDVVRAIRRRATEEKNLAVVGREFGISRARARGICLRIVYKHVTDASGDSDAYLNSTRNEPVVAPGESNTNAVLTEEKVREIRLRNAAGERYPELGREFGVHPNSIRRICLRKSWTHVT